MRHAIVYDCEYLTREGAFRRNWSGSGDPDPLVVQIGAVKLGLDGDCPLLDRRVVYVLPLDRQGRRCALDPYFTALTGVTEATLATEGLPLAEALTQLTTFADGARLWCWGRDEYYLMAVSCYVAGIAPPIPALRFGNAADLLVQAGATPESLLGLQSGGVSRHYGLEHPPLRGHDALDDALSVAYTLQHLLREGTLTAEALLPLR